MHALSVAADASLDETLENATLSNSKLHDYSKFNVTEQLPSLLPTLNVPSKGPTTNDMIEASQERTKNIGGLINELDRQFFSPSRATVAQKTKSNKKKYHTSLILQAINDNTNSDSQFRLAKEFNIRCLYIGVDPFLRKKREAYKKLLMDKKKQSVTQE